MAPIPYLAPHRTRAPRRPLPLAPCPRWTPIVAAKRNEQVMAESTLHTYLSRYLRKVLVVSLHDVIIHSGIVAPIPLWNVVRSGIAGAKVDAKDGRIVHKEVVAKARALPAAARCRSKTCSGMSNSPAPNAPARTFDQNVRAPVRTVCKYRRQAGTHPHGVARARGAYMYSIIS